MKHEVEAVWDAHCTIAESPVFDEANRRVLFADARGGRILSYSLKHGTQHEWTLPSPIGSFGLCASGRLVVALERQIVLFDPHLGQVCHVLDELDEPLGNRFNDGKVGPDGYFWVGTRDIRRDSGLTEDGNGSLYRIGAAGRLEQKASGLVMSNGLAWTSDGMHMYHADTPTNAIFRWDFAPDMGAISNRQLFATTTATIGRPDGGACDQDGCYWSAGVSAGRLNRYSSTGRLIDHIAMPCPGPSMPCFADEWLFITSNLRPDTDVAPGQEHNIAGLFKMPSPSLGVTVGSVASL